MLADGGLRVTCCRRSVDSKGNFVTMLVSPLCQLHTTGVISLLHGSTKATSWHCSAMMAKEHQHCCCDQPQNCLWNSPGQHRQFEKKHHKHAALDYPRLVATCCGDVAPCHA
jgi:hypothetical protein